MKALLHPTYFPNVAHFVGMLNAESVIFEHQDNYQKQTYRNRTFIYAANGKLALNIPVNYTQNKRQLFKDVRLANVEKWQSNHWKSLMSAYNTSPFFEYYQDELAPLFESKFEFLFDFNLQCLNTVLECLQIDIEYDMTSVFEKTPANLKDLRQLVNPKFEQEYEFAPYVQVFTSKFGFIENLSILDVLFNEGPSALSYLRVQELR